MKKIFLRQVEIVIIIGILVMAIQIIDNKVLNKGYDFCIEKISVNYSKENIVQVFNTYKEEKNKSDMIKTLGNIAHTVMSPIPYGDPIDVVATGTTNNISSVYAVNGGTVINVGTSDELGNYIIISHGEESISTYGNCSKIYVKKLQRVRKGEVIGEYMDNNPKKKFFYSIKYNE